MRRFLIPAVLGLALAACQDQSPKATRSIIPAQAALSQGNHFFFLPPLAPQPNPTGTFNGNLFPVVEICTLTGPNGTCTGPLVGTFTRLAGTHNELVTVVSNSFYQLNWDTDLFQLPNGTWARITVRSAPGGGTVFGFADVFLSHEAEQAAGQFQTVGVQNGTVVPINFIMENGILCQNDTECFEGTIDSNGGTFTFPDGSAGLLAPAGAINPGEAGNLVIERYHGPDPCLPTDFPQYEACLRVHIEGTITTPLNTPVDVGFCLEAGAPDVAELEAEKWDELNPNTLKTLPSVDVSGFITCAQFGNAQQPRGELARLAHATGRLLKPVASLFGVKPAYAASTMAPGPIPFGAGMSDFSRIGVVRPLKLDKISGDNGSATVGSAVTPTVKVTSKLSGAPVAGVHVKFTPTVGVGPTNPVDAFTDLSGLASTSWTLGVGSNAVRADAFNPESGFPNQSPAGVWGSATFNGTGIVALPLRAVFLPPVAKNVANPVKQVHPHPVTVSICLLDASKACTSTTFGPFTASDGGTEYQVNWKTPKTLAIGAYRITVTAAGNALTGSSLDIQGFDGGKGKSSTLYNFQTGSNVPLKFSIETP